MARYGRGLICLSMTAGAARRARDSADGVAEHARGSTRRSACRSRRKGATTHRHLGRAIARRRCWRRSIRRRGRRDLARPGPHVSAALAHRRRDGARRADRSGGRPGAHRRAVSGRRHLRNHERGRHDGARAGAGEVREAARPADDHHRGSDQVPDAHRIARQARRDGEAADRLRRLPRSTRSRTRSTSRRTSRWCAATSATARTCWSACTRSA